jgi:hypothetical protein
VYGVNSLIYDLRVKDQDHNNVLQARSFPTHQGVLIDEYEAMAEGN